MEMSRADSTVNFIIHDANGQPQIVKVVQNTNNQIIPQIKIKPNPLKIIKLPISEEVKAPIYRSVNLGNVKSQRILTVSDTQNPVTKVVPKIKLEELVESSEVSKTIIKQESHLESIHDFHKVTSSPSDAISNMSHGTRRRLESDNDPPVEYTTKRRKHADKVGKGLRHFSMKVCEKVRNKGFTSYNEVADELVLEFAAGMHGSADSQQYDQKNIRRRVYDALNVLMAMNIISKEKKEIRWLGLPTNSVQECNALEKEKQNKIDQIHKKTQQLQELILQHISFKSLIERNKDAEHKGIKPSPSSAIHLPFIVVNTSDKALIDCSISNDKTEYMFNFNKRFQIHDDIDILKRMGLLFGLDKGECSEEDIERAKSMVPKSLENYVTQMAKGDLNNIVTSFLEADGDEEGYEDDTLETEDVDDEPEEQDAHEYSDDSTDVDV